MGTNKEKQPLIWTLSGIALSVLLSTGCASGVRPSLINPELGNQPYAEFDPDEPLDLREGKPVYIWPISSPDGSRIIFVSQRDGNTELYVMNSDGTDPVNLTRNSADDGNGSYAWSPAGDSIVFSSRRRGNWDIYTVRPDGRKLTRITRSKFQDYNPVWSPDGGWLTFSSNRDGSWQIYRMRLDGSGLARMTSGSGNNDAPVYSPDGRWIGFISDRNGSWDIFRMPAVGGFEELLTPSASDEDHPRWSSDGKRIIFESDMEGNWDVYSMKADGSDRVQLTRTPAAESSPVYSPDMKKVAFASYRDGNPEIYVMEADGSEPVRLTFHPDNDICPYWSPDGSLIYFSSNRDGREEIFAIQMADFKEISVSQTAGSDSKKGRLSGLEYREEHPTWSSDGKWVSFGIRMVSGMNWFRTDILTGEIENVTALHKTGSTENDPEQSLHGEHPSWSNDRRWIAFESNRDGNWDIYVESAAGGETLKLTHAPGADTQPVWSPDDQFIAFTSHREGSASIYVMARDGSGQEAVLLRTQSHLPEWTRDGKELFYVNTSDKADSLQRVRLEDGVIRTVVNIKDRDEVRIWHPSSSPDGRLLAFVSNETGKFRVWLVDLSNQKRRMLNHNRVSEFRSSQQQAALKSEGGR